MERTFIMLKPDAVQRGLVGEIIARFEKKGFKLAGMKLIQVDRALAEAHYAEHRGKGFFEATVTYIMSSPVVAMVWQGKNGVAISPLINGSNKTSGGESRGPFVGCTGWILVVILFMAQTRLQVLNVRLHFISNLKNL